MDAAGIGRMIGYIVGSLSIGALLGLIPFFVGRKRGVDGLAAAALICCAAGNIAGLGIIIAIIFLIIILVKS